MHEHNEALWPNEKMGKVGWVGGVKRLIKG